MSIVRGITMGQYMPGTSAIHSLDPRCKIISLLCLMAGLFSVSTPFGYVFWLVPPAICVKLAGLNPGSVLSSGRAALIIIFFTVAVNVFWTPGRELVSIGPLTATYEGAVIGICMGARLYLLVLFAAIMMMTTSPISFSGGLERLMSPLARVGFPASEVAMMMTIALRFIPTLFEETDRIIKAQLSRGADFSSGGLVRRARSYLPILIPLFVLVFRRAEHLASAMDARCFVPGAPRGRLRPLVWTARDTAALAACAIFALAASVSDKLIIAPLLAR